MPVPRASGHRTSLRAVLRSEVSMFFLHGRLVTSDLPSGGSPDPSVCPTGGDSAPVLVGDFTVGGGLGRNIFLTCQRRNLFLVYCKYIT